MSESPDCSEWIQVLELKAAGNQLFKNGEFGACIEPYSHAIELAAQLSLNQSVEDSASQLSERVVLLSNRAAAYLKLMQPHLALLDCEQCISLSPRFVKGYFRKALALHQLNEPLRAETAAAIALSLDPRGLRRDAVMIASFPALLMHACPYISCGAQLGAAPESFEGATELDKALKAALPGTTIVLAPGLHDVTLGEVRVPLRLVGLGAGNAEQRAVIRQRSRLMGAASALEILSNSVYLENIELCGEEESAMQISCALRASPAALAAACFAPVPALTIPVEHAVVPDADGTVSPSRSVSSSHASSQPSSPTSSIISAFSAFSVTSAATASSNTSSAYSAFSRMQTGNMLSADKPPQFQHFHPSLASRRGLQTLTRFNLAHSTVTSNAVNPASAEQPFGIVVHSPTQQNSIAESHSDDESIQSAALPSANTNEAANPQSPSIISSRPDSPVSHTSSVLPPGPALSVSFSIPEPSLQGSVASSIVSSPVSSIRSLPTAGTTESTNKTVVEQSTTESVAQATPAVPPPISSPELKIRFQGSELQSEAHDAVLGATAFSVTAFRCRFSTTSMLRTAVIAIRSGSVLLLDCVVHDSASGCGVMVRGPLSWLVAIRTTITKHASQAVEVAQGGHAALDHCDLSHCGQGLVAWQYAAAIRLQNCMIHGHRSEGLLFSDQRADNVWMAEAITQSLENGHIALPKSFVASNKILPSLHDLDESISMQHWSPAVCDWSWVASNTTHTTAVALASNETIVSECSIFQCGSYGITVQEHTGSLMRLLQCRLYANSFFGLFVQGGSSLELSHCSLFRNLCGGLRIGINFDAPVLLSDCHVADNLGHAIFDDLANVSRQRFIFDQYQDALNVYRQEMGRVDEQRVQHNDRAQQRRVRRQQLSALSSLPEEDDTGDDNQPQHDSSSDSEEDEHVPEPRRPFTMPPRLLRCMFAQNVDISDPRPDRHAHTRTTLIQADRRVQSAQLDLNTPASNQPIDNATVVSITPARSVSFATPSTQSVAPTSGDSIVKALNVSNSFAFLDLNATIQQGFAAKLAHEIESEVPLQQLPWHNQSECAYCLNPPTAQAESNDVSADEKVDNVSTASPVVCARCSRVRYCNRDCQRAHWRRHRPFCWSASTESSEMPLIARDEASSLVLQLTLAPTSAEQDAEQRAAANAAMDRVDRERLEAVRRAQVARQTDSVNGGDSKDAQTEAEPNDTTQNESEDVSVLNSTEEQATAIVSRLNDYSRSMMSQPIVVKIETDLAHFDAEDARQPLRLTVLVPLNQTSESLPVTLTVSSPPLYQFVMHCGLHDAVNLTAKRVFCYALFEAPGKMKGARPSRDIETNATNEMSPNSMGSWTMRVLLHRLAPFQQW